MCSYNFEYIYVMVSMNFWFVCIWTNWYILCATSLYVFYFIYRYILYWYTTHSLLLHITYKVYGQTARLIYIHRSTGFSAYKTKYHTYRNICICTKLYITFLPNRNISIGNICTFTMVTFLDREWNWTRHSIWAKFLTSISTIRFTAWNTS